MSNRFSCTESRNDNAALRHNMASQHDVTAWRHGLIKWIEFLFSVAERHLGQQARKLTRDTIRRHRCMHFPKHSMAAFLQHQLLRREIDFVYKNKTTKRFNVGYATSDLQMLCRIFFSECDFSRISAANSADQWGGFNTQTIVGNPSRKSSFDQMVVETMGGKKHQPIRTGQSPRNVHDASTPCAYDCDSSTCLIYKTTLCVDCNIEASLFTTSSTHKISARRTIIHPKENPEFVLIICHGWAARSIMAPDGHRQILSFLLPGDLISTANLFASMSGHSVDAITDVTYRKFKQSELKAALFKCPALLEKLSIIWIDERVQADQLTINISRKSADKRIAWLILSLAKRLTKNEIVDDQRIDFPLRQQHMAHATGLTHVYVGKVLGEFQRAGLIEISNRSLRIINAENLRHAAGWQ